MPKPARTITESANKSDSKPLIPSRFASFSAMNREPRLQPPVLRHLTLHRGQLQEVSAEDHLQTPEDLPTSHSADQLVGPIQELSRKHAHLTDKGSEAQKGPLPETGMVFEMGFNKAVKPT